MKRLVPIIILFVIIVGSAGYWGYHNSSKTSSDNNMAGMNMSSSQSSSNTSQAQATDKVTIRNFAFSPAAITVKKGTTVTWTNQDSTAHTVTESDSQDGPKSDNLAQGASYTFTFNTTGTFKYHCLIHPDMIGTVTVTE